MYGRLRDEPVGQGQAEDAGDKGRAAEEEEIPVEAAGLLEGIVSGLRGDGADVLLRRVRQYIGVGYCIAAR